jgi:NAD(P)-dependent dehydrogenase (short-subunit alcohol dehydrogenase family)
MCKRALERFTTGLAAEQHGSGVRANALRPGLVDTPGVAHFGLLTDETRHRETPVHHVAEVCLALASGGASLSGRVQTSAEFIEELALAPVPLPV